MVLKISSHEKFEDLEGRRRLGQVMRKILFFSGNLLQNVFEKVKKKKKKKLDKTRKI